MLKCYESQPIYTYDLYADKKECLIKIARKLVKRSSSMGKI